MNEKKETESTTTEGIGKMKYERKRKERTSAHKHVVIKLGCADQQAQKRKGGKDGAYQEGHRADDRREA